MDLPRRFPARMTVVIAGVVAVIALGGYVSANAGTPSGFNVASSSPVWCCVDGQTPGLTVTGEGQVHGRGTDARDAAIARAVADATDQAKAAADAAGVTLGAIVDMQVSSPQYPYAVPEAVSGSSIPGPPADAGSSGASAGAPGGACPMTTSCDGPIVMPVPFAAYASVTITWAIG
jgi:Protein of unknown function (DUF541).